MSMDVPLWFGQQRGSGFAPYDIEFEGDKPADEHGPVDDVGPGVLGLLALVAGLFAGVVATGLPLLVMIALSLVVLACLGMGGLALFKVATSENFPAWAGVTTYALGLMGRTIKWAFIIATVVFAVALLLGLASAMSSSGRR